MKGRHLYKRLTDIRTICSFLCQYETWLAHVLHAYDIKGCTHVFDGTLSLWGVLRGCTQRETLIAGTLAACYFVCKCHINLHLDR